VHAQADVVDLDGRAVEGRAGDRDLELPGQEAEFGVQARPLPQSSQCGLGSSISSAATPAYWSVVTFLMQLPEVWMACISTSASASRMAGTSSSFGQLNWMFWRVVKWP
jgi:hypothetical protein